MMFDIAAEEIYEDGQIICKEGSEGDWIYIVESGTVELYKELGEKKITIEFLQPGVIFGQIAFFAKIPRPFSARAVGPTTVEIIDRRFLDKEYSSLSESFQAILKSIALRLVRATEKAAKPTLRRKDPRIPKVLSLSFKRTAGFVKAFSEDLSAGGMFIKTNKPLEKGENFVLKLRLPDNSKPLKIGCNVVWSRQETENPTKHPLGMGIKFTDISKSDNQKLVMELIKAKNQLSE
jgi:uncharacterized protein (TIGR02266 family)